MTATPCPDGLNDKHAQPHRAGGHASLLSLLLLGSLLAVSFAGVFGGDRTTPVEADTPGAQLEIHTPTTLRSGLFFETRIVVTAKRDIADATIALPHGLWRDFTINTAIPAAEKEEAKDGGFRFHYGPLKAGERLDLKFDGQINPPLFAGNRGAIALLDGERTIAAVPLTIRVLP